jgi:putative ABC transport system permease protein
MTLWSRLRSWVQAILRRSRMESEMDTELRFHIEAFAEDLVRSAVPRQEALRRARIEFGGIERAKEECREARGVRLFETVWQDTKYGLRMLRKSPAFTATAILTLSLGIGANTAIFSVVNAVLLQPLSYPHPDRLVALMRSSPAGSQWAISVPKFIVYGEQTKVFESIAAYDSAGPGINLTGGDRPEQVKGIHASAGYFEVFAAPIALGRVYTAEEDRPGGPHVAAISDGLWRRRFGGDPTLVGRTVELSGDPYQIIGVLGPGFKSDPPADIWLPLQADPNSTNQGHYLRAAARMRSEVTLGQAQAAMKLAVEELRRKFPNWVGPRESATAVPLRDTVVSGVRSALLILLGAVGFVLLIACANVANLLLARATLRKRELAIRASIGAGRWRIVSQLLTESLLLSLMGGALGLVIGFFGLRALLAINPVNLPRIGEHGAEITLDSRVLLYTLLVSLFTATLFGLIPASSATREDLNATLRNSGARSGGGFRQNKTRSILVVTEMALALILLVGAALMIRTFEALRSVRPGFDRHNVLTMQMALSGSRFKKTAGASQMVREVEQRVGAMPGVEAVAGACCLPLTGGPDFPFAIVGRAPVSGSYSGDVQWRNVSPQYFEVFRIPALRGRVFTARDDAGSTPVALINEAMAKQFWQNENPIGAQLLIGHGIATEFEDAPRQIVGVVGDIRDYGLNNEPAPIMYVPEAQVPDGISALENRLMPFLWAVRTKVAPFSLDTEIQQEVRATSGGLAVAHVRSMEQVVGESTARGDFNTMLLSIFAGVALLLAATGVYGLMVYAVQQRTQEIGIRMALGASPEKVRKMVVWQGMRLAVIGVVIGVVAALELTRFMAGLIYRVKTWDPTVFAVVAVLLSAAAWLAAYVPALRASRVDPIVSLRYE